MRFLHCSMTMILSFQTCIRWGTYIFFSSFLSASLFFHKSKVRSFRMDISIFFCSFTLFIVCGCVCECVCGCVCAGVCVLQLRTYNPLRKCMHRTIKITSSEICSIYFTTFVEIWSHKRVMHKQIYVCIIEQKLMNGKAMNSVSQTSVYLRICMFCIYIGILHCIASH